MKCPEQSNLWGQEVEQWLPRAGGGETEAAAGDRREQTVSFRDDETVLKLTVVMVEDVYEYTENH